MGEGLVLADQLDGSDIVDASIAKDIVRGGGFRYLLAFLADYDAEFALIDNLAVVGLGPADDLVGAEKGIVALEQVKRFFRLRHAHLGGQGVEVVPQCDHLGRLARRQQLHVGEEKRLARRLGPGEHVALVNGDGVAGHGAETHRPSIVESSPKRHRVCPLPRLSGAVHHF